MPYGNFEERGSESQGDFLMNQFGKYQLSLPLDDSTDKQYTLSVTVTDSSTKKSIAQNYSFVGLRSSVMPGIKFDRYYYRQDETANLSLITVDSAGTPKANQKMNYKLIHLTPEEEEENEYGEKSQPTKETVLTEKELTSGTSGAVSEKILFSQAGRYRVEVSIGAYTTSYVGYVSGDQSMFPIRTNPGELHITTDKPLYQVGDVAKVAITSPEK